MAIQVDVKGAGLRAKRRSAGLSQRELARRLGVTQNYIPAVEAGSRQLGARLRSAVCQILGADFDDIFVITVHDEARRTSAT